MNKGTIYIDGNMDAERLVTLLANQGYTVRVRLEEGSDLFGMVYRIDYKKKEVWTDK